MIWHHRGWPPTKLWSHDHATEQGDEADEVRLALGRGARVGGSASGAHRERLEKVAPFAAYPRCSTDTGVIKPANGKPGRARRAVGWLDEAAAAPSSLLVCWALGTR